MRRGYKLSTAAEADLRDIIRYTRRTWGVAQVRRYTAELAHGMARCAAKLGPIQDFGEIHPGLRATRSGSHYVFCLDTIETGPLIIAILHQNMDLMARISARFTI